MAARVLNLDDFTAAMEVQRWKFAHTYARLCPHYYTVERWWQPPEIVSWEGDVPLPLITLQDCARFIEEQGEPMIWGSKRTVRMYVTAGGFRYWQMDPHWSKCDLINRQELSLSTCKPVGGLQLGLNLLP